MTRSTFNGYPSVGNLTTLDQLAGRDMQNWRTFGDARGAGYVTPKPEQTFGSLHQQKANPVVDTSAETDAPANTGAEQTDVNPLAEQARVKAAADEVAELAVAAQTEFGE
jgi:hypothetical protein